MKIVEAAIYSQSEIQSLSNADQLLRIGRDLVAAYAPSNRARYGSCIVREQYVEPTRVFVAMLDVKNRLCELGRHEDARVVFAPMIDRATQTRDPEMVYSRSS